MKPNKRFIILFLAPAILMYSVFFLYPIFRAFYISLFRWSGIGEMKFRGLGNFKELLIADTMFFPSLRNTMIIWIVGGALIFILAFFFTALLNSGIKGKRFFRAVIYLPNVIATVALTTLWGYIYNTRYGLLSSVFQTLGLETLAKVQWMASNNIFWAMLIALVWGAVGFYLIILMAGVERIPLELYEAAKLDGANQVQTFFHITIPLLRDVITVAVVLWTINALKIFEFPYAFTQIEPVAETYTAAVHLFVLGFGTRTPIYRMGKASAIGVILLLLVTIIVALVRRLMRREVIQY